MICPNCNSEAVIDASAGADILTSFLCGDCGFVWAEQVFTTTNPEVVIEQLTDIINAQSQRILQLEDVVMLAYDFLQLAGNLDPQKERAVNRARLELDKAITPEMEARTYVHVQKLTGDISDD